MIWNDKVTKATRFDYKVLLLWLGIINLKTNGVAILLTVILHEYHFNDKDTETEVRTAKLQLHVVKSIDTNSN